MRGLASWYLKGLPKSHEYKDRLSKIRTYDELVTILDEYQKLIEDYQASHPDKGKDKAAANTEPSQDAAASVPVETAAQAKTAKESAEDSAPVDTKKEVHWP